MAGAIRQTVPLQLDAGLCLRHWANSTQPPSCKTARWVTRLRRVLLHVETAVRRLSNPRLLPVHCLSAML